MASTPSCTVLAYDPPTNSFSLYRLTMMASEDPIVEVPTVLASSWIGALNSLAIMLTHPVRCLAAVFQSYGL
jgi:hypothetical protein